MDLLFDSFITGGSRGWTSAMASHASLEKMQRRQSYRNLWHTRLMSSVRADFPSVVSDDSKYHAEAIQIMLVHGARHNCVARHPIKTWALLIADPIYLPVNCQPEVGQRLSISHAHRSWPASACTASPVGRLLHCHRLLLPSSSSTAVACVVGFIDYSIACCCFSRRRRRPSLLFLTASSSSPDGFASVVVFSRRRRPSLLLPTALLPIDADACSSVLLLCCSRATPPRFSSAPLLAVCDNSGLPPPLSAWWILAAAAHERLLLPAWVGLTASSSDLFLTSMNSLLLFLELATSSSNDLFSRLLQTRRLV
ncbi:hypothetical protein KSP39_PZI007634 [Platanthera zijinensis]|uniref:Uncharacterized protein n=1 Tax=Platanthera zijinensis TaxID=2320716 RepID=A0AAP0G8V9_9ASPA